MKLLLVDDEVELASTLAERLGLRGFDAKWASSGDEAIRLAAAESFDVAVLDMKMPGVSGLELKRRLSEIAPSLRFILITGHGSVSDFMAGQSDGLTCLIKPVNIETLTRHLRALEQGAGGADDPDTGNGEHA
ncbi:MAG: response regulator [Desulfovibrionaceae bacterium]|jgi:DNA-binding response OmpR family regulator|nr:response regulator [Desulfovibrionaceae bacterium]